MFHILLFDTLTSTNDYIKEHGHHLSFGDVVWAKKQTKGRGRLQRIWYSKNDLTFSICFQPSKQPHHMISALAVVFALERMNIHVQIKWPNDLIYQNKKCGGILIERIFEGNQAVFDIVGIGINIEEIQETTIKEKAIALPISNQEQLLDYILYYYRMLQRMDLQSIHRQYKKYSWLIGKTIFQQRYKVKDVNEQGELIVEHQGVETLLRFDEITLEDVYQEKKE